VNLLCWWACLGPANDNPQGLSTNVKVKRVGFATCATEQAMRAVIEAQTHASHGGGGGGGFGGYNHGSGGYGGGCGGERRHQ